MVFTGIFSQILLQTPWEYESMPFGVFIVYAKICSVKTALHSTARNF